MAPDDADDEDVGGIGPPLPPDDRLWRHPSELREHGWSSAPIPLPSSRRPRGWRATALAALAGALLTTGAIAASGALSPRVVERSVVEKVAVLPVVSSPILQGERGVDAVVQRLAPAVVRLDVERAGTSGTGTGTGVVFRDDGLVLTSAQVVAGATAISVVLADGRTLVGRLLGTDAATDVAVVDVDGRGFPVAVLGRSEGLAVGAPTIAIGSSSATNGGPTVVTGVVSALAKRVVSAAGHPLHGLIQTDAPTTPGAAGGALVDATGAVIGISTDVAESAGPRFGFATPIDLAHEVAEQILRTGHMDHGWLGIDGEDLPAAQAHRLGVRGGAVVRSVAAGSPAAAIGLVADDVITELDGHPLASVSALVVELLDHHAGDRIALVYWRLGERRDVSVTLGARPQGG
jgi:S1-C subfamily serine protease